MFLLADETSATAQAALPYVVVAFVSFAILLWFVLAESSPTGSALSHALWGSPFALFIFCCLAGLGLTYGMPTLYKKMGFNPFGLDYGAFGKGTGIFVGVVFFLLMFRRIRVHRRRRAARGY
jgi:hypothetical protein